MPVTDPVADMLTRIRNAITARHGTVDVPVSRLKLELARIMKEEGFIQGYQVHKDGTPNATMRIRLHYRSKGESQITGLKRVSKPGLRTYVRNNEIPRYYGGLGVAILSTSEGVMTGRKAGRQSLGGELLCYIW